MGNEQRVTRIGEHGIQGGAQTQPPVGCAQEQDATVTADVAAGETRLNFAAIKAWKVEEFRRTIWHERSPVG